MTQARVLCQIYVHDAQGHAVPEGECIYIRQSTSACVITNMLHFWHSKTRPNLKATAQLTYIVTDADCDYGRLFYIFITFLNVSMTYPILVYSIVGLYSHSYGICIEAFMAINGKEFHQMNNQW